jgi:hypothetical protein
MSEITQGNPLWTVEDRRRILRELLVHEDKLTADRIQALYTLQAFFSLRSDCLLESNSLPLYFLRS